MTGSAWALRVSPVEVGTPSRPLPLESAVSDISRRGVDLRAYALPSQVHDAAVVVSKADSGLVEATSHDPINGWAKRVWTGLNDDTRQDAAPHAAFNRGFPVLRGPQDDQSLLILVNLQDIQARDLNVTLSGNVQTAAAHLAPHKDLLRVFPA